MGLACLPWQPWDKPDGSSFLGYWGSSTCHRTSVLLFVCVGMSLSHNITDKCSAILATGVAFISLHLLHKLLNSGGAKAYLHFGNYPAQAMCELHCGGRNFSIRSEKCWQDRPFSKRERKLFAFRNLTVKMTLLTRSRMNLIDWT